MFTQEVLGTPRLAASPCLGRSKLPPSASPAPVAPGGQDILAGSSVLPRKRGVSSLRLPQQNTAHWVAETTNIYFSQRWKLMSELRALQSGSW